MTLAVLVYLLKMVLGLTLAINFCRNSLCLKNSQRIFHLANVHTSRFEELFMLYIVGKNHQLLLVHFSQVNTHYYMDKMVNLREKLPVDKIKT